MSDVVTVWVIDDDASIRWVLERTFSQAGMVVRLFEDAESAVDALAVTTALPDVLVSDIRMPGLDGLQLLNTLQQEYIGLPVIIMTAHSDLDSTVAAYEGGAFDYLPKPFDTDRAIEMVRRACAYETEQAPTRPAAVARTPEIIGGAPAMQGVFRAIGRLSRSSVSVLINGESGTGKELIAQALHRHSPRQREPFVALNMSAIPRELMESELFGHEKGSFTGAQQQRRGHFEQANHGTLFLDEIGDMPIDMQTRLLRVLSDGTFFRVGGTQPIEVDVRIVAATHQDLEARVRSGDFREDLFHRLNVIRVAVPALRERAEDIPVLLEHFLGVSAESLRVKPKRVDEDAMVQLCRYAWPGNVRELQNTAHWLTVMASGQCIELRDLPEVVMGQPAAALDAVPSPSADDWRIELDRWARAALRETDSETLHAVMPTVERILIRAALAHTRGHRQQAARALGWGRNTLTRKIKDLGIDD